MVLCYMLAVVSGEDLVKHKTFFKGTLLLFVNII